MLRLTVSKRVELKNWRLRVFYNVLQLSMVVVICVRFLGGELWVNHLDISRHMAAEIWATGGDAAQLAEVGAEKASSPLCDSPSIFDFRWDDTFVYRGHECLLPCGAEGAAAWPHCVYDVEIVRRESEDQLFFVTQFEERRVGDDEAEPFLAFVPLEEALGVSFRYGYAVQEPSWLGFGTGIKSSFGVGSLQAPGMLKGRSDGLFADGILTVLLDASGSVREVLEPRLTIDLSVSEILDLAGLTGALDEPNPFAGRNVLEGTQFPEGGLGRITGLNVDIKIECMRKQRELLPSHSDWSGPVCYATAERSTTRTWAAWDFVAAAPDGSLRQRINHGLRVRCITSGRIDFFDADQVFLQISSSLVFIALPNIFMFWFIIHAMGHLSKIYRGVIVELFDIPMECARITARLMSNSVTFVELEDIPPDDLDSPTETGCISKRRLREQLQEVMRFRGSTLDEREMIGLVNYCHDAMLNAAQLGARPTLSSELRNLVQATCPQFGARIRDSDSDRCASERQERTGSKSSDITIDDFSMCCASSERLEFESFVALFDEHRGITLLEHFFLPHRLRPLALCHSESQDETILPASIGPDPTKRRSSLFNLRQRHQAQIDLLLNRDDFHRQRAKSNLGHIGDGQSLEADADGRGKSSRAARPSVDVNGGADADDVESVGSALSKSKDSRPRRVGSGGQGPEDPEWQRASSCLAQLRSPSTSHGNQKPPPPSPERARRSPNSPSPVLGGFDAVVDEPNGNRSKLVALNTLGVNSSDPAFEVEHVEKSESQSDKSRPETMHIPGAVSPLQNPIGMRDSEQWGEVQLI